MPNINIIIFYIYRRNRIDHNKHSTKFVFFNSNVNDTSTYNVDEVCEFFLEIQFSFLYNEKREQKFETTQLQYPVSNNQSMTYTQRLNYY